MEEISFSIVGFVGFVIVCLWKSWILRLKVLMSTFISTLYQVVSHSVLWEFLQIKETFQFGKNVRLGISWTFRSFPIKLTNYHQEINGKQSLAFKKNESSYVTSLIKTPNLCTHHTLKTSQLQSSQIPLQISHYQLKIP